MEFCKSQTHFFNWPLLPLLLLLLPPPPFFTYKIFDFNLVGDDTFFVNDSIVNSVANRLGEQSRLLSFQLLFRLGNKPLLESQQKLLGNANDFCRLFFEFLMLLRECYSGIVMLTIALEGCM